VAALALLVAAVPLTGAVAVEPDPFSEAEIECFVKDRLGMLAPPTRLHYRVTRRGSLQPEFDQSAELVLTSDAGVTTSRVSFLSGDQRLELPALADAEGNPILLHFLEREVRELSRLTGGSSNYYRKRIRLALAGQAQVVTTRIEVGGRTLPVNLVRIRPFHDDPARVRYDSFADRHYEMAFSDQVPGGIVRLHAELRSEEPPGTMLWAETVSFDREDKPGDNHDKTAI
jgi:hypothetical protein